MEQNVKEIMKLKKAFESRNEKLHEEIKKNNETIERLQSEIDEIMFKEMERIESKVKMAA